ncbi:Protein tyrosine kinase [Carpediemonas membranifera]|uniref:Protein tyrosine kinase n=1 Tax=Carpediemonas membranifera TaxID=201153 RepID=A0A8J6B4P3_9EUKA|nr:Protein tyrosine kinase [Carpediemonas membranifera]|eukprot:KAG9392822.1 Protein tyrosine kinase [Carpediemonas membranifera]
MAGADIEAADVHGNTPLVLAARGGFTAVVRLLVDRGCKVDGRGCGGTTAMLAATERGHDPDVVLALLLAGADFTMKNNDCKSPKDVAKRMGHIEILRIVRNPKQTRRTHAADGLSKTMPLISAPSLSTAPLAPPTSTAALVDLRGTAGTSPSIGCAAEPFRAREIDHALHDRPDQRAARARIIRDIAAGMEFITSRGIVHRDLKGDNVLMIDGRDKITDFGSKVSSLVRTTTVASDMTVYWAAPERFRFEWVDEKSDVYSLAMVMMEVTVAGQPWGRVFPTIPEFAQALLSGARPPIPPGMPAVYRAAMERCWAQEPGDRPSFGEVWSMLRE